MTIHYINEFLSSSAPSADDVENIKHHAELGNNEAQYHLALIYDTGNGLPRNPREAEKWYRKSAEQGNASAQYYLGKMYSTQNSGVRSNPVEAKKWFEKAANQGHVEAAKMVAN